MEEIHTLSWIEGEVPRCSQAREMGKLLSRQGFCQLTGLCFVQFFGEFKSTEMSYAKMGSKLELKYSAQKSS